MKRLNIIQLLTLATFVFCVGVGYCSDDDSMKSADPLDGFTTVDGVHTIEQFLPNGNGARRFIKVWPTEVAMGDTIYCVCYDYNVGGGLCSYSSQFQQPGIAIMSKLDIPGEQMVEYDYQSFELELPRQRFEFEPTDALRDARNPNSWTPTSILSDIRPGEKHIVLLKEFDLPFPKFEIAYKQYESLFAKSNELLCQLEISTYETYPHGRKGEIRVYKLPIRLKRRDETELRLFNEWKNVAEDAHRYSHALSFSLGEEAASESINAYYLRKLVNPKFDYSNPPLSENKWKEVEDLVQPSVVRDNISFARMLVAYFTEKDEQKAISKRKDVVSWLIDRPEPLRYELFNRIYEAGPFWTRHYWQRLFDLFCDIYDQEPSEPLRRLINSNGKFSDYNCDDPNSYANAHFVIDADLRSVVEIWPLNVKVGDPVYCRYYVKNISNASIKNYPKSKISPMLHIGATNDFLGFGWEAGNVIEPASSKQKATVEGTLKVETRNIPAGQICDQCVAKWRFPSANELDSEFWSKALQESYYQQFKVTARRASFFYKGNDSEYHSSFEQLDSFVRGLVLKLQPRAQAELDLLKGWQAKADEVDPESISELAKARPDDLVGAFLRLGNPFPHYPNAPETVEGWRALEEQIEPSALRDEISFPRMIMEYYDEKDDEAAAKQLKSLSDWLETRPAPQRFGLIDSIRCGLYGDETNEVYKTRLNGLVELFDQLTDGEFSKNIE